MIKIEARNSLTTRVSLGLHIFHGKQENTDWKSIHSFRRRLQLGSMRFQPMETKANLCKIKIFHAEKLEDIFYPPLKRFPQKAHDFFLMQLTIIITV